MCAHVCTNTICTARRDYGRKTEKKVFKIIAPASCETRAVPLADYSEAGCGLVRDVDHCVFYVEFKINVLVPFNFRCRNKP